MLLGIMYVPREWKPAISALYERGRVGEVAERVLPLGGVSNEQRVALVVEIVGTGGVCEAPLQHFDVRRARRFNSVLPEVGRRHLGAALLDVA